MLFTCAIIHMSHNQLRELTTPFQWGKQNGKHAAIKIIINPCCGYSCNQELDSNSVLENSAQYSQNHFLVAVLVRLINHLTYRSLRSKQGKRSTHIPIWSLGKIRSKMAWSKYVLLLSARKELILNSFKNYHWNHPEIHQGSIKYKNIIL